jgi:hypothetical protein
LDPCQNFSDTCSEGGPAVEAVLSSYDVLGIMQRETPRQDVFRRCRGGEPREVLLQAATHLRIAGPAGPKQILGLLLQVTEVGI